MQEPTTKPNNNEISKSIFELECVARNIPNCIINGNVNDIIISAHVVIKLLTLT